jgi:pimeloyl-ACP methyl ester carboxylesterase
VTAENTPDPTAPDTIVLVHGLWVTPRSWEHWIEHYEGKGYRVLAPAYPGFEVEVEALNEDRSPIEVLTIPGVVEHLESIVGELENPPIIMGHSAGGLFTQILLDHGYGAAGVAIDSAPAEGVIVTPVSQIRSLFPVLRNPANRMRAVPFTPEQFHYAFTNTLSREESDKVYERYHIPAPGRFVWAGPLANFTPGHQDTYVDFSNEDRAPLLFIAGGEDNLMPPAVNQSNAKMYRNSSALTDYHEFEGRSHYTVGQDGWEEVADYALEWAVDHAKHPVGLITPSRSTGGGVQPMETHPEVRPFRVDVPEEDLDELRRRIAAASWPTKELVEDRSQGVQLATLKALARYWQTDYDWRKAEEKLNALPQFTTEIDGLDIHFIHVRSKHEDAFPLIMTHGWPGSVIELLETIGPLTDPTAYGGNAGDAFHLVLPSLPGYGFSSEPAELGWDAARTGRAWAQLMRRLGYTRYVAQGGDVGALVTDLMGRQAVEGLAGYHLNLLTAVLAVGDQLPKESEQEQAAAAAVAMFRESGFGYFLEMATRPQTIGYALLDSPVALAAWLLDHDTDSYYKISRAFVDGQPSGNLTRETIVDNITLYWLTGTGASAARSYWEDARALAASLASGQPPPPVTVPVGFTTFPDEIWASPRSWVEAVYPGLAYFNEVDRGGHFAAWEEPQLFSEEVRAAFSSLR